MPNDYQQTLCMMLRWP